MHRSGTSFTAHALQLLGVSLGSVDRLMAPGPDNPAGYWENRDIKELNDEVLSRLGGSWDQPPVLGPGGSRTRALIRSALERRTSSTRRSEPCRPDEGVIGWKDPRLSLLLPFWRTVTPIATTIVMVRDPAEVAASLRARNGIDEPQAAMLWLRYLSRQPRTIPATSSCDITTSSSTCRARSRRWLLTSAFPHRIRTPWRMHATHLDPSLRHHVAPVDDPVDDNPLVALAAAVWNRGSVDLEAFPSVVAEAIRWGWLRPPIDGELLARARAQVVELRDRIRQRRRQERAAQNAAPLERRTTVPAVVRSVGDGSSQSEDVDG